MASPRCRYGHDHGTPSVTLIPDLRNEALKRFASSGDMVLVTIANLLCRVVYDEKANLLTGNGPQAIDNQAAKLRQLLDIATQRGRPATTRTPA